MPLTGHRVRRRGMPGSGGKSSFGERGWLGAWAARDTGRRGTLLLLRAKVLNVAGGIGDYEAVACLGK